MNLRRLLRLPRCFGNTARPWALPVHQTCRRGHICRLRICKQNKTSMLRCVVLRIGPRRISIGDDQSWVINGSWVHGEALVIGLPQVIHGFIHRSQVCIGRLATFAVKTDCRRHVRTSLPCDPLKASCHWTVFREIFLFQNISFLSLDVAALEGLDKLLLLQVKDILLPLIVIAQVNLLAFELQWLVCGQRVLRTSTKKAKQLSFVEVVWKGDQKIIHIYHGHSYQNLSSKSLDLLVQKEKHLVKWVLNPPASFQAFANMHGPRSWCWC